MASFRWVQSLVIFFFLCCDSLLSILSGQAGEAMQSKEPSPVLMEAAETLAVPGLFRVLW